jgi:hypothetical protein
MRSTPKTSFGVTTMVKSGERGKHERELVEAQEVARAGHEARRRDAEAAHGR